MATKRITIGGVGPLLYDDSSIVNGITVEGNVLVETAPTSPNQVLRLADVGALAAPGDAEYLVVSLNGTLTNERKLTEGAGISFNDGGAGGNFTIAADGSVTKIRITSGPYAVLSTDVVIFANSDAGDVVVNLPAGVDSKYYKIVNTGTSGNQVTVNPNGAEHLGGVNSGFILNDGEFEEWIYDSTDGWY